MLEASERATEQRKTAPQRQGSMYVAVAFFCAAASKVVLAHNSILPEKLIAARAELAERGKVSGIWSIFELSSANAQLTNNARYRRPKRLFEKLRNEKSPLRYSRVILVVIPLRRVYGT
jgi:hypothetical protein